MDHDTALRMLESLGVVFCQEGGDRWKAAGIMAHLGGIHAPSGELWVALSPMETTLDPDARSLAMELLNWAARTKYETPRMPTLVR